MSPLGNAESGGACSPLGLNFPVLSCHDLTLPTLAENLDHDVSLLRAVNENPAAAALRFWEFPAHVIVVGKSNAMDREVDVAACETDNVQIFRRDSGGGAVVIGPGCLCFSLALPIPPSFPELGISGVTCSVMKCLAAALSSSAETVAVRGISDLVVDDRKISGNSQRWLKHAFLHHGTVLYDFDLSRISRYLRHPTREPYYREHRSHADFVANLRRTREELVTAIRSGWNVTDL